ncbi:MAG TPA: hypothetical protein ENI20_04465 [Bacteroides sp.]|nr:hypothetical protein [Bacteroides sp.]
MKMKRLKFSRQIAVLAILMAAGMFARAQTYSESQKIVRSFSAGSETRLDLSNKYGTVHIIPWNKDSVHIEIDLFIQSSSASKLGKLKRNVDFEFSDTRYYIIANTIFGSKGGNFFSDLKDLGGTIIPSKNDVKIDYTVHVPSHININITNKYGDIYIDDMKGSVSVNLSNGDIKANSLTGESNISLNFGNGIINELSNSRLNIAYADIDIQLAGQLNIESKSSKIRIREVDILKILSKRDKYSIGRINNLFGESWFSNIWISKLGEEINYTPKYGALKVDSIPVEFSFININTEFTDLNLVFNRSASYQLEIMKHTNVILHLPEEYGDLEIIDQEEKAVHLKGMVGPGQNTAARVKITAPKKCIINIQSR